MNPLKINGLIIEDFPQIKFESIYTILNSKYVKVKEYEHFTGAWNALSYRYKASYDHGRNFIKLLKQHGTAPEPDKRYLQEQALFNYFNSCFSVFESMCYGFYAIGSIVSPDYFFINDPSDQRKITPESTCKAFQKAFPGEIITNTLTELIADSKYISIRDTRNILTHRTAPGRKHYLNIGNDEKLQSEWKLNDKPLDDHLIRSSNVKLNTLSDKLLNAFDEFCKLHL